MIEANSDVSSSKNARLEIAEINQALPTEMLRNILQRLDIPCLCAARKTCKRWREIINGFKLVEEACSKYFLSLFKMHLKKVSRNETVFNQSNGREFKNSLFAQGNSLTEQRDYF